MDHVIVIGSRVKELRPSNAIANREWFSSQVVTDGTSLLFDTADDFMPEQAGTRVGPFALPGVDVGPADRTHRNAYQQFSFCDIAQREFTDLKRSVGRWVDGGTRSGSHERYSWGSVLQGTVDGKVKNIVIVEWRLIQAIGVRLG